MKSKIIALACVLTASACAATNNKPAQEPASSSNFSAPTKLDSSTAVTSSREVDNTNRKVDNTNREVDNTKVNERDRSSAALTPMDQGNSGSETKISADIRRGIMGDDKLSFTAKNVKIITVGTKVTLRGPVKSVQEKTSIEAIASQTAGVVAIDNQLEVKN